jgi:AcrR family transcriptional regulator
MSTNTGIARRTRARRGEGERLREDILAAAEQLMLETGDADAVSIRSVAKAVGVTPPSIYLHFADKTDLIFEVCRKHWSRFEDHLRRATEGIDDPLERLRACGRAYIRFGLDNPAHYRILFMHKPEDLPAHQDMEEILSDSGFARMTRYVEDALRQGVIEGEPAFIVFHAWSVVHGLTSLLISHPDMPWPDHEALIEHTVGSALRGFVPTA